MSVSTAGIGVDLLRQNSVLIDYTSLDEESLARDLTVYAATRFSDRWTNFSDSEPAVMFLRLASYIGDGLFYQLNATLGEKDPLTCVRRQNFIDAAKSFDFFLRGPVGSSATVTITADVSQLPIPIDKNTFKVQSANGVVFMPVMSTILISAESNVEFEAGDLLNNTVIGISDSSGNQRFVIPGTSQLKPLLYRYVNGVGSSPILEVRVNGAEWSRKNLEADAQSTDEIYFLRTNENDLSEVVFGDGINGKIPPLGATIRATAKTGFNVSTNVNPRTITTIVTALPGITSITNKEVAAGGSFRQTLQEGKAALPATVSTNDRGVIPEDFSDLMLSPKAPAGVWKAAASAVNGTHHIWVVPAGGGLLTPTLTSSLSSYMRSKKIMGWPTRIRDRTDIPIVLEIDVFVAENFRADDVIAQVRAFLLTEDPSFINAVASPFDFKNLGLAARDDSGRPQLTRTNIQAILKPLLDKGLQKIEVPALRTIPQTKVPADKLNSGNGTISGLTYLKPRDVPRREFRIEFISSTAFRVYRRIVGSSTFLTDNQLFDDRLDLGTMADFPLPLPGSPLLNPNIQQSLVFGIDTSVTSSYGDRITKAGGVGSIFGTADTGDDYYLEFFDGLGSIPAPTLSSGTYVTAVGDLSWAVNAGTVAFSSGDIVTFDVFPVGGPVVLRADEHPIFRRSSSGTAVDFKTNVRTAE